MKTIFLFIPHYFYSSDLLRTNYIKYLATKYKVIVFSPIFSLNPIDNYYQSPNVTYLACESQYPKFWLFFNKLLRVSLIREFDNLEYHKLRAKTGINLNWKRKFLKLFSKLIPAPLVTADFFTKLEKFLLPNSKLFKDYLKRYKPDLILTSTPGFSGIETEAILLAKKNGLKTAAINFSWDNLFNNAKHIRKTDYLICWNDAVKKAAQEIHNYPDSHVFTSGIIRFDHHFVPDFQSKNQTDRRQFLLSKNLSDSLKTVLFTTVPPQIYPFQPDFLQRLVDLREKNVFGENFNIYVRLHPRDEISHYQRFFKEKNIHIEWPGKLKEKQGGDLHKVEMDESDLENLRKTFLYSDIAVNFRSSITLETCVYDLPTINLAYNNYTFYYQMDHYIPILKSEAVKLVENEREFIEAMKNYLKNPKLDSEKRQKISKEYVPFQDGLSYKRNVDFLNIIIETTT